MQLAYSSFGNNKFSHQCPPLIFFVPNRAQTVKKVLEMLQQQRIPPNRTIYGWQCADNVVGFVCDVVNSGLRIEHDGHEDHKAERK
jgi:hypothetical protein